MNSLVVLIAAVACLAQSYAGIYHGVYGHGGLYAGAAHGVAVAAPLVAVAPVAVAAPVAAGGAYHGPLARPVVLPSGFLADTPEVAAVKGAHITALATTSAVAAASGAGAYGAGVGAGSYGAGVGSGAGSHNDGSDDHLWAVDGSYRTVGAGAYGAGAYGAGAYGAGVYGAGAAAGGQYAGPLAAPVVLPSGYLADTHAVVAARGAHLTAVANSARAATAAYAGAYGAGHYGHGYHH